MNVGRWSRFGGLPVMLFCALALFVSSVSETFAQPPAPNAAGGQRAAGGARRGGRGGQGGFGGGARGQGRRGGFGQPALGAGSPPAEVPAAVAMARATDADVEQVRQLLATFKESNADAKRLLDKYPDLLVVQPPRPNSAIVPSLSGGFVTHFNQNVEIAKAGDIDVVFQGDSITDLWDNTGQPVLEKYFGGVKVANFGISGDTTQGVLYRQKNGEGQGFSPKAVMLMIGTNNTGRNSPEEIAEGIGAVVLEMRHDYPDAKILLLGVFPRSASASDPIRGTIKEINGIIAKLNDNEHVFYMDIGDKFLDAEGNLSADIMPDRLHPSEQGYEIWANAVKDKLAELVGVATLAPAAAAAN